MPNVSEIQQITVDCAGGLILNKSMFAIPDGGALKLQNFEPDISGGYRRINGFSKFDSNAVSGTGAITGIYNLGSNIIACRAANVEYSTGSGWTSITSGRTGAGMYHFDTFNFDGTEKIVMVCGDASSSDNYAATWDGTTYTEINHANAPTNPNEVAIFREHLFLAEGELLYFSAPYDETDFDPASGAGNIRIPLNIVGMHVFRDALYIFCRDRIFKLVGDSVASWELVPVANHVGAVTCYSIQEVGGDVVFLSRNGLRTLAATERYGDVEMGTISGAIHSRLTPITSTTIISSCIVRAKNQYRMWFVEDGDTVTESRGIIGYLNDQPTTENSWEFSDIRGMKPGFAYSTMIGRVEYVFHGDYSSGHIYRQENDDNDFDGTAIEYIYRSPNIVIGDLGHRKNMQRAILSVDYEGTVTTSLIMVYDAGDSNVPQPTAYNISETAGAVYGTAVYGTDVYSEGGSLIIRQSVEGSGFTAAIELSGNSTVPPFSVKGFQLEFTPGGRR